MVDKKDRTILRALKKDARHSTHQISKAINIPVTTVHHRIKRMEKEGVIRGYTTLVDNKKLGILISAYVLITVDYNALKKNNKNQYQLGEDIKKLKGVESVDIVAGETDLIAKVHAPNVDELNDLVTQKMRMFEGIDKTKTVIVLQNVNNNQ